MVPVTEKGRMAPRVNRWPMSLQTEVRHCVTLSPFVITNADWISRHYLVSYLIVVGNRIIKLLARAKKNCPLAGFSIGI